MLTFDEVMPVKFGWTVGETNSKIDHLQFQPLNSFSDFVFTQQNMNLHLIALTVSVASHDGPQFYVCMNEITSNFDEQFMNYYRLVHICRNKQNNIF